MSRKRYIKYNKETVIVDFPCVIEKEYSNVNTEGKTYVFVQSDYSFKEHHLSVYYRPERTWDDHMGNTPSGYYCNVPMPNGKRKRVYMFS